MLESLKISNFQIHRSLELKLDERITTIVGPNDRGKSAALRALRWICLNDEVGDEFISWGSSKAKVQLKVDGCSISRVKKKGGKGNFYLVNGKRKDAVKRKVPKDIAEVLNLSSVNFQDQLDSPFWFDLTPGQLSKELNHIVSLESIDEILSNVASRLRRAKTVADVVRSRLDDAKTTRKRLKWVRKAKVHLSKIEAKYRHFESKAASYDALLFLLEKVQTYQDAKGRLAKQAREGQEIVSKGEALMKLQERVELLQNIIKQTSKYQHLLKVTIPNITELESLITKVGILSQLIEELEDTEETKWETEKSLRATNQDLEKMLKGKICPVCGKPMTK